jgi:hypothetical protein
MGKSVDLPDPLEAASTKPLGNADDLLAQLANEEVDRLLAEAETEGKQKAEELNAGAARVQPEPEGAAAPMASPEEAIQGELDALFSEITAQQPNPEANPITEPALHDEPPMEGAIVTPGPDALPHGTPAPAAPAPINMPTHGPASSNLADNVHPDDVLAAIIGGPGELGKLQDFTPAPPPPAALLAAHAALAPPVDAGTSAAERAGLAKIDPADGLPGPGELAALSGPIEDDAPLPVYLKPLEWMSAPLDLLPSTARDVLGQVAILTLVNAIAVLIYVFVFRKH